MDGGTGNQSKPAIPEAARNLCRRLPVEVSARFPLVVVAPPALDGAARISQHNGKAIPTRWVGEQHVREDLGRIRSFADWVRAIRPEPWMGRATTLGVEDAPQR